LFDPVTYNIKYLGTAYATYAQTLPPYVDLYAISLEKVGASYDYSTGLYSVTLRARFANAGNSETGKSFNIAFSDSASNPIGAPQLVNAGLSGCFVPGEVLLTWSGLAPGTVSVSVTVDSDNVVSETHEDNNQASLTFTVLPQYIALPLVGRTY
jgi:hypothetical protein